MRKTILFFAILCFIISLSCSVSAASDVYEIDEADLKLTIPSRYDVFTLDMPSNDPLFAEYGFTKSDITEQFAASNIYLNAIPGTGTEEIVVTMMDAAFNDFKELGDTFLLALAASLVDEYTDYGIVVTDYDLYHHDQLTFIRIYFHDESKSTYGLQYYTMYNAKAMNFTMRSYNGNLSSTQEKTILNVVDSIETTSPTPVTTTSKHTNAFSYTDKDSGVKFTVPENWEKASFTEDREFLDVKFVSIVDPSLSIMYGGTDIWSQMPPSERMGYKRTDMNSSVFTVNDIAESFGIDAELVNKVSYNGSEYYKFETAQSASEYGFDLAVTMTCLVRIDNGWAYWFQFGGTPKNALYCEFENLLNSVEYPVATDNNSVIIGVIVVVGLAVITCVIMAMLNNHRKSVKQSSTTVAQKANFSPSNNQNVSDGMCFCRMCGTKLPIDSTFCYKCGTKIEIEV